MNLITDPNRDKTLELAFCPGAGASDNSCSSSGGGGGSKSDSAREASKEAGKATTPAVDARGVGVITAKAVIRSNGEAARSSRMAQEHQDKPGAANHHDRAAAAHEQAAQVLRDNLGGPKARNAEDAHTAAAAAHKEAAAAIRDKPNNDAKSGFAAFGKKVAESRAASTPRPTPKNSNDAAKNAFANFGKKLR